MPQHPYQPKGYGLNSYIGPCGGKHVLGFTCVYCELDGGDGNTEAAAYIPGYFPKPSQKLN